MSLSNQLLCCRQPWVVWNEPRPVRPSVAAGASQEAFCSWNSPYGRKSPRSRDLKTLTQIMDSWLLAERGVFISTRGTLDLSLF